MNKGVLISRYGYLYINAPLIEALDIVDKLIKVEVVGWGDSRVITLDKEDSRDFEIVNTSCVKLTEEGQVEALQRKLEATKLNNSTMREELNNLKQKVAELEAKQTPSEEAD